ncbi:DNA-binding response regulator, OmpR family, contains REC and winged-helix (wHTH) domain [Paenibacillus sp. UNCCL117]|uniref:response regulator transcription factor n=1 Tax=unclassified Paenibacillus TaxID=185978 RepID=UPI000881A97E|nr:MULTISPECIES: response regulator transcription factor [unclassified Paenibacillus]SDE63334.1 DNA-binding response regulator, OmpR family, contains REC and winged-helix (wHTH) domain [Paenibacillus sp. cl123]SFW70146.1 DNA-binding response regulator, OmpR family, contains REC and winged-helix (wHTH) domain [Paenibacillus sp. UNCCL117]
MSEHHILLVEDDKEIGRLIQLYLDSRGYKVRTARDGGDGLRQFETEPPDLVLLDIGLPGMNGLELCRCIRRVSNVPIIFISCNTENEDIIRGLGLGADDYITKPFDPNVLIARVEANLRRAPVFHRSSSPARGDDERRLVFGGLEIDIAGYSVRLKGAPVNISTKEMQILLFMARHPDQIFTAEQLYREVWGVESYSDARTVVVHISSLRKKIETHPSEPAFIQNVRGYGYKFNSQPHAAE